MASKINAILHVFANGAGLIEFDGEIRPEQIEDFKKYWAEHNMKAKGAAISMVGNVRITVVEHRNPLGPDYSFDQVSHAFGAIGEYKEDEEIEAFVEALKTYVAPG